ncbi:MAG TPA: HPF/RaiA family ribosome-associated protein [Terracidiphilus sp.]|nr:HPF/RaiA family ribosome-associated protein [Terracidiphilus sp.]
MSIEIRSRDFSVTDAIREHAGRRLGFALDSLPHGGNRKVRRVVARLGDLNGPKGGEDKFCRIAAQVGHCTVVVEHVDSNLYSAITHAAHRFVLAASRHLARELRPSDRAQVPLWKSIAHSVPSASEFIGQTPQRMLSSFMDGKAKHTTLTAVQSLQHQFNDKGLDQ